MTDLLRDGGLDEAVCWVRRRSCAFPWVRPKLFSSKRSSALAIAACRFCGVGEGAAGKLERMSCSEDIGNVHSWGQLPPCLVHPPGDGRLRHPKGTSRFRMGQVLPDNENNGVAQQRIELPERARDPAALIGVAAVR